MKLKIFLCLIVVASFFCVYNFYNSSSTLFAVDSVTIVPNGTTANGITIVNQKVEVSTTSIFLLISTGNVVIGAASASSALDVVGGSMTIRGVNSGIASSGRIVVSSDVVITTGAYYTNNVISFSSTPIMHVSGYNSTLGANTTFFSMIPDSPITLKRITSAIVVAGVGGAGDTWIFTNGVSSISCITAAALPAGNVVTSTNVTLSIPAGQQLNGRLVTTGDSTSPTANVTVEYQMQ